MNGGGRWVILGAAQLGQLVEAEFEIELGDLVIEDENFFVLKGGPGFLKIQKDIQLNIIPIGKKIGLQKTLEIGTQVLPQGIVFGLELLQFVKNIRRKTHAKGLLKSSKYGRIWSLAETKGGFWGSFLPQSMASDGSSHRRPPSEGGW